MGKAAAALALSILISATTADAEEYLCVADAATGFAYGNATKQWQVARFKVDNDRYIIKKTNKEWVWKKLGEKDEHTCNGESADGGLLTCEDFGAFNMHLYLERDALRFQLVYLVGYLLPSGIPDSDGDTPFIEIGRCSLL